MLLLSIDGSLLYYIDSFKTNRNALYRKNIPLILSRKFIKQKETIGSRAKLSKLHSHLKDKLVLKERRKASRFKSDSQGFKHPKMRRFRESHSGCGKLFRWTKE